MQRLKQQTLTCLLLFMFEHQVITHEINVSITFRMTWDEEDDILMHKIWSDVGVGPLDLSSELEHSDIVRGGSPRNNFPTRFRRNVPPGDYVRHGPGCLNKQMDLLADETPKEGQLRKGKAVHVAMMATEREEAQLTCHYCDKDADSGIEPSKELTTEEKYDRMKSMLWFKLSRERHKKSFSSFFQLMEVSLDLSDQLERNRVFVTESHTLVIRNVSHKDGGTYFCRDTTSLDKYFKKLLNSSEIAKMFEADDKLRFLYHLDVIQINDPRDIQMVTTDKAMKATIPMATPDKKVMDLNVQIFTVWEEWSPCSSCDQMGTRRRLGVCMVKKIDQKKKAIPWYLNMMLEIFTRGVLCRSTIFKTHSKLDKLVRRPGDEMEEPVCNISCTNFTLKMKDVVAGGPSTVKIKVFVLNVGDSAALECPKAPKDMPVAWINGTRVLIRPWLKGQTDGRVSIDESNTFHISSVRLTDAGHYLCAVGGRVLGRVMVGVEPIPLEARTWRFAWYLMCSYPFDFALFMFFLHARHVERNKVLNYDLLENLEEGSVESGSSDAGSSVSDINVNRSNIYSRGTISNIITSASNNNNVGAGRNVN